MNDRNKGPETASSLKIRTKSGEIIDLAEVVRVHKDCLPLDCFVGDVAAALARACSVFKDLYGNEDCTFGYHSAIADVRQAAGVVEDDA